MRAAIYIRVSTLDQAREGYSLATQERTLRQYCADRGHTIHRIYADEGISGKDIKHRPAMQELLTAADAGQYDTILVWSLSRLTRSVADLYNTWEQVQRRGIGLISYTESFDTSTPTGRAMMGLLGVFAQMEREITAERVKAALIERAAQGKRTTNEVLGYDLDGSDNLTINEKEAERVRYIFSQYPKCRNLSTVAELCNLKGYHGKRGKNLKAEHIKKILTRPIYAGYNSFCGEIYRGTHEPIIDTKTYEYIQHLLKKRKNKNCPS